MRPYLLTALVLTACSGDGGAANPAKLWLSLVNGDERQVQLSPVEPNPF